MSVPCEHNISVYPHARFYAHPPVFFFSLHIQVPPQTVTLDPSGTHPSPTFSGTTGGLGPVSMTQGLSALRSPQGLDVSFRATRLAAVHRTGATVEKDIHHLRPTERPLDWIHPASYGSNCVSM